MRRDSLGRCRIPTRDGFTFAELLLVLALLLIVTGLVFPPVLRMMADQPLKEAAERARVQLATVRLKALDSSSAWQLRFEPGGRNYLWMPTESSVPLTANSSASTATAPAGPTSGELPKGINFSSDIQGVPLVIERLPQETFAGMPNAYQLLQTGWSAAITFQPDGSAVDSELAVINGSNRQIRLTVRGFTGGVTVSPIETRRR
jgi:prepilin-type N-terminal cleavage/methylation domain-containing protein